MVIDTRPNMICVQYIYSIVLTQSLSDCQSVFSGFAKSLALMNQKNKQKHIFLQLFSDLLSTQCR